MTGLSAVKAELRPSMSGAETSVSDDPPTPMPSDEPEAEFDPEIAEDDLYNQLVAGTTLPEPPRPINWNLLSSGDAEATGWR